MQQQIQKKAIATTPAVQSSHSGFAGHGFTVQKKPNNTSADLKTQLSRATRFGHSMSQMSTMQAKAATETIQRQQEEQEEPEQMKSEQSAQPSMQPEVASSNSSNSIPGGVLAKMEKSFGTSFSDINVHTNSVQAKSIGALAYTQGNNVHFAPGQYNPDSPSGQALLGHELTHVMQQRAGRVPAPTQSKGTPINADPSLEKEADDMGAKAAQGELVQVPGGNGSLSPIQNSTEPVQCFLPLLMGAASMLGGPGGLLGGALGGAASGLAGGLAGSGGPGGLMGGVLGGAASGLAGGLAGGGGPGGLLGGVLGGAASGLAGGLLGEQQ
ncbi:hypothetical protein NIES4103_29160 [Nostoc sp. NIES-4103]|nr:hypothetical protein NIES4103_29160 [Nostoc sp. NIES-4103]